MDYEKMGEHVIKLHTIGSYMISRNFEKLIQYIEDEYFSMQIFDDKYYSAADDFVFRMDITGLSYSSAFELAYRDLKKIDYGQYLIGLKSIIVKLKGNQRYTYYDREGIRKTLKCIEEEYSLTSHYYNSEDIIEKIDGPVGFEEMNFEDYYENSTKSIYSKNNFMTEKFYEAELKTAVKKGIIYHYIVEADHYINENINTATYVDWVFLAKLLALYYTTEKKPWTSDMTRDMLRIYYGIKECCEQNKFEEIVFQLITENLKLILKKISMYMYEDMAEEIVQVISYLNNAFMIHRDERYVDYIKKFSVILEGYNKKKAAGE